MIEFKDGRYFSVLWFIPGRGGDFMAAIWKNDSETDWQFAYRFRYYVDDRTFDSKDRKSWWSGSFSCSEGEAVQSIDRVADALVAQGFGGPVHKVLLKSDRAEECLNALAQEKWAHVATAVSPKKQESR